jgi:hypothetical protein
MNEIDMERKREPNARKKKDESRHEHENRIAPHNVSSSSQSDNTLDGVCVQIENEHFDE